MSLTIVFSQLFLMKCDVLPFSLFQIDIFASKYLIPQYSGSRYIYPHTCIIMILHKIISNYFTQIWLKTTGTCFIQKYMPPPLPYFKVHICPFPLPTSPQYFSLICDPFANPIISLHSRDISLFDSHMYI